MIAGAVLAARVLLIDGDPEALRLAGECLEGQGYDVDVCRDGLAGLRGFHESRPDLVILEAALTKLDGWEVCRRLRELSDVPVLFLTCHGEVASRVRGFDVGADDYLTKPFEPLELLARVRAVLRRARALRPAAGADDLLLEGDLRVDLRSHRVTLAGRPVELTPTEFRLLVLLVQHSGRVLSQREILSQVWGPAYADETSYVKLYVRYLREKLEVDPRRPELILTERGFGYRFARQEPRLLQPRPLRPPTPLAPPAAAGRRAARR